MTPSVFFLAVHILIAQTPRHEDCIPYNPESLRVLAQPSGLWLLTDGSDRLLIFASKEDAQNGLALASRYYGQCYIGRHFSTRRNMTVRERTRYIVHYWKGPTGKQTTISPETCQPYTASELHAEDKGEDGWIVTDGKSFKIALDNRTDADALMALARQYTSHCTIGPPDQAWPLGRVDYWK